MNIPLQIPFDPYTGNMLSYAATCHELVVEPEQAWPVYSGRMSDPQWKDNYEFETTLYLEGMSRGRSAANFSWMAKDGRIYNMFMTDMVDLIKNARIDHGSVAANWTFTKRGQNYGIKLVK